MLTKRGIAIVRHLLPEPNAVERELAVDQLGGSLDEWRTWPTHALDGTGHYLVIPPRVAASLRGGSSDLIDWQTAPVTFQFDGLFSREVA
jgi:hypothetical protein